MKGTWGLLLLIVLSLGCTSNDAQLQTTSPPEAKSVELCQEGEVQSEICPNGTEYDYANCVDGEWHVINYLRNPCESIPTTEPLLETGHQEATISPHTTEMPIEEEEGKDPAIERAKQGETCDDGPTKFNSQPADLEKIAFIKPMGLVQSEHVAPTDHIYLWSYPDAGDVDVYSPAGGVVNNIQHMGSFRGDNNYIMNDYYVNIQHGCGLDSIFIHIDKLSPKLAKVAPEDGGYVFVDVPVEAGEVIGTYSGSLDYMVVDTSVTLAFANLESYKSNYEEGFQKRVHISDPIAYFNDPSKLIEKSLRIEEPVGGLLDYDVDGKLVGTWFEENTNGWNGRMEERYWAGHLAIIYNAIDPEHVIVSTGNFNGRTGQFGVKGNSPDPGEVGVGELVKYELVGYDYYDGDAKWDGRSLVKGLKLKNNENINYGIVLFELIEDQKLKVEFFPDKKSSEVDGFTDKAVIYER